MILKYLKNVFIGIDQAINAILGGDPDETISSRFGKWLSLSHTSWRWKIAYVVCRMLHILDKHHCLESIETDEGKNELIK